MLKPICHLRDLFSCSISTGIFYICKKGYGSCQVKVMFLMGLVFWEMFLAGPCYSEYLSSSCLNTLFCCNVASRPVIELLFCLEKLRGFMECLVGKKRGLSVDQNEQLFQAAACTHAVEIADFNRLQLDIWFIGR